MRFVTHNAKFHADDVFGAALLTSLHPDAEVVRTRDEAKITEADIVFDVGGVYDEATTRYDHHQNGAPKRENGITYSAFGLLWRAYGKEYCDGDERVWREIDRRFVQPIDAADNGEQTYELGENMPEPFTIADVVDAYNPLVTEGGETFDSQFMAKVAFAKNFLARLKARELDKSRQLQDVIGAYERAADRRIVMLDTYNSATQAAGEVCPDMLYTLFPNTENENWTVLSVRAHSTGLQNRKSFPEAWAGLTGEELANVSGVADAVFCHKMRFIAVAKSREGARRLAAIAADLEEEER